MPAYAIAHLRRVDLNDEIADYLRRIDATIAAFDGRFLVHGARPEKVDGDWEGTVVVIEFPDLDRARAWYASAGYQAILPLRLRNSDGDAILVQGVPEGYRAANLAAAAR